MNIKNSQEKSGVCLCICAFRIRLVELSVDSGSIFSHSESSLCVVRFPVWGSSVDASPSRTSQGLKHTPKQGISCICSPPSGGPCVFTADTIRAPACCGIKQHKSAHAKDYNTYWYGLHIHAQSFKFSKAHKFWAVLGLGIARGRLGVLLIIIQALHSSIS